jgi:hypothetical protein
MAATKYDFSIEQGTSFRIAITYKDKNKNPIDITGYCARLMWVTNTGQTQVLSTENTDPTLYRFTVGGTDGQIVLMLPASITNTFDFNLARYDLELRSDTDLYVGGGKEISRLLYGTISLVKRNSKITSEINCNE